jgi:hypothetical protein
LLRPTSARSQYTVGRQSIVPFWALWYVRLNEDMICGSMYVRGNFVVHTSSSAPHGRKPLHISSRTTVPTAAKCLYKAIEALRDISGTLFLNMPPAVIQLHWRWQLDYVINPNNVRNSGQRMGHILHKEGYNGARSQFLLFHASPGSSSVCSVYPATCVKLAMPTESDRPCCMLIGQLVQTSRMN